MKSKFWTGYNCHFTNMWDDKSNLGGVGNTCSHSPTRMYEQRPKHSILFCQSFIFWRLIVTIPLLPATFKSKVPSIQRKMGIPSELRDAWVSKRNSFIIASPDEERKILRTKKCTHGNFIFILSCIIHNFFLCLIEI